MKAMILAAGMGTRLKPFTEWLPKPCIPLLNIPLGYWPLFHLLKLGVRDFVVNTHHLPKQIESLYQDIETKMSSLNFSHESEKILNSGGGILNAKKFLEGSGSFFAVNADEVFLPHSPLVFENLKSTHLSSKALATLLLIEHPEAGKKFGAVWCDADMRVLGFGKNSPHEGLKPYHYVGFQILSEKIFNFIPDGEPNIFYDVLVNAISQNQLVNAVKCEADWHETGNLEDLLIATRELLPQLEQNVLLQDIAKSFWPQYEARSSLRMGARCTGQLLNVTENQILLGNNCKVGTDVKVKGFVVVGDGAKIGDHCTLENVIIRSDSIIESKTNPKNTLVI